MKGVVDRIEEGMAVIFLSDGERTVRPAAGLREGDSVEIGETGVRKNERETDSRRRETEKDHRRIVRRSLDNG